MALLKQKAKPSNIEELRDITDDVLEEDFVPYACHWDDHTIVTKNGEVLQIIKMTGAVNRGLTAEDDETDLRSKIREAILACVDSTEYAVWIHTLRRQENLQTKGEYKRDFSGYLNRFWNDSNDWDNQFINEIYITLIRVGENAKLFDPRIFVRGIIPQFEIRHRERYLDDSCQKLSEVTHGMLPLLERYGARRLGVIQKEGIYISEPSAFLGKLATLRDNQYPLGEEDISRAITDYDVTFGYNAMEVRMRADGKRRFGAILTLRDYRELPIHYLERVLQTGAEFIISQCFDFINAKEALKQFEYQKYLYDTSNATLIADRLGIDEILSHTKKNTDFGLHQITFFILADSIKILEQYVARMVGVLTSLGMTPLREDIKLEECYWGQMPANFEFIKRLRPINTARIGGFSNLGHLPAGTKDGNHWGSAITTLMTAEHIPYFFNFHVGDSGHTSVIGPAGTEKNVLINFLLSEARKFNPQLIMFDQERRSEIFIRSLNGAYYNLMPAAGTPPYAGAKLNPFSLEDTAENRAFLKIMLRMLAGGNNDQEFLSVCETAIASTLVLPLAERKLATCVAMLGGYASLFARWVGNGEYAALFNNQEESLYLDDMIIGFDMSSLMRRPDTIAPVMAYLLHKIEMRLDGKPTMIVLDEAWTLLAHPYFIKHLAEYANALRAKNAMIIFATEQVGVSATSAINAVIMSLVATQIYLPDEEAGDIYETAFGLDEHEVRYLSAMNTQDRHFLVKQNAHTAICELNLRGMSDILAVLSASLEHLSIMEQIIAQRGITPTLWMPKLLEQI